MTDTRQAFLVAIRANPDADLPRLVFADWLDENGESERAGFVRLSMEKDRGHWGEFLCLPESPCRGCRRADKLLRKLFSTWPLDSCQFSRGFLSRIELKFMDFVANEQSILAESVELTVRLMDRPVVEYKNDSEMMGYRLAGHGVWWPVTSHAGAEWLLRVNWPEVKTWELPPGPTGGRPVQNELAAFLRRSYDEMRLAAQNDEQRILNGDPNAGRPLGVMTYRPPRA